MSSKHLKNLSALKHIFDIGQDVYFACLIPRYEWFNKEFTIESFVEPQQLKILKYTLMPDNITKTDSILVSKLKTQNVIRKYIFHITLEDTNNIKLIIFESRNKEITILHESNKIIGYSYNEVELDFIKLVMSTKRDLEFDKEETIVIKDEIYERFIELYLEYIDNYPEEIIKIHDSSNLL